jgi:3-mercaptopyruvate sulfurtransferase SseA
VQVVTNDALPASRVKHLEGGVFRWNAAGLPMVGEYDASNAGKTPASAERPTGDYIDGK